MNDGLKQRVVGAFVLAALAIIFLPMLFDFSGERYIDTTSQIPPRPDIAELTFEEPKRPQNITFPKPAERSFQPEEPAVADVPAVEEEPTPEPVPAPGLNEQGLLAAWVIQVGAFSEQERARKLEKSLLADGYKAYQRENPARGLFFVYIGPDADKQTLLQAQKKVDSKYRVKSKILSFEP
ncbi:SPOR domain-containing protein [bacterium SCSIO 12696]|nr:SPOR domain-containing protein [bacterium SCSIO 12696]